MAERELGFSVDDGPSPYVPLRTIRMSAWQGLVPAPRTWRVDDWLPDGEVTSLYGDGGVGKTLLAQQLGTSCALGLPWIGLPVAQCPVFGLFCEDSQDEIQRRQQRINANLGIEFDRLDDFALASGKGEDNELIQFVGGRGDFSLTDRFCDLVEQVKAHQARLVIIDTAANTFGGNENDRRQVGRFIGTALARLARDIGGAVLLNAHPSRTGLKGDMDGGSTGWNNSVRSRWSLERSANNVRSSPDPNTRILTRRKANYAQTGAVIPLTWGSGMLVPANMAIAGAPERVDRRTLVHAKFMELLAKCNSAGMKLSESKHSGNYAPKMLIGSPEAREFSVKDFEGALHELLAGGRIALQPYGRKGDARTRIVAVNAQGLTTDVDRTA